MSILDKNDQISSDGLHRGVPHVVLPEQGNYSIMRKLLQAAVAHAVLVRLDVREDDDVRHEFGAMLKELHEMLGRIS